MATIKAFKAYRYTKLAGDVNTLVYPMSEQLSSELLTQLQHNPYSAIHFSHSRGKPSKPYPELIKEWIQNKVIEKDPMDTLYVWYQYYADESNPDKISVRKGFTCQVRLEEWADRIILPHEQVIPKGVNNKQDFLSQTGLSFAPVQAIYEEKSDRLEKIMDEAIKAPMYDFTDAQQIRNVLAPIHDYSLIKHFENILKKKQIILADGHHRYHAALENAHVMDKKYGIQPDAPWHFLTIYLSNSEDPGLKILPFHREFTYEEEDLPDEVIQNAEENFNIFPIKTLHEIPGILAKSKTACSIVTSKSAWILELKGKLENSTYQRISSTYIGLIQEILVDKNLKKTVNDLKSINYSSNFTSTINAVVAEKRTKLALILQPTAIEEVKRVCYSGGIMPEKSTFFYPKLMAGLLFSRIENDQQT